MIIELTQLNFKLPNGAELGKNGPLGPTFFSLTPNLIFLCIKSQCKISEPYDNPFFEKSKPRREKEKNASIVDAWFLAAHASCSVKNSRALLRTIWYDFVSLGFQDLTLLSFVCIIVDQLNIRSFQWMWINYCRIILTLFRPTLFLNTSSGGAVYFIFPPP